MNKSSSSVYSSTRLNSLQTISLKSSKTSPQNYCNDHNELRNYYDCTGSKHLLFCFEHVSSKEIKLLPTNFKKICPEIFEFYSINSFKFQNSYGPVFKAESNYEKSKEVFLNIIDAENLDPFQRKNVEKICENSKFYQKKNERFLEIYNVKTIEVDKKIKYLIEFEPFATNLKKFLRKNEEKLDNHEKMDIFTQVFEEIAELHKENLFNIELELQQIAVSLNNCAKICVISALISHGLKRISENKQGDYEKLAKLLQLMLLSEEDIEKMRENDKLPEIINKIVKSLCMGQKVNKIAQINELFELLQEEKQARTAKIQLKPKK